MRPIILNPGRMKLAQLEEIYHSTGPVYLSDSAQPAILKAAE